MAVWTRGICKIGATIQSYKSATGTGWLGNAMGQVALSIPRNASTMAPQVSKAVPVWASEMMRQQFVLERTMMWGYSRNPVDQGGGDYSIELDIKGGSNTVAISVALMGIWRASHKGMDQGASAGYMRWKDVQIYDTAGTLVWRLLDDGVNEMNFTEANMMSYNLITDLVHTHSAPIGRVYVLFNVTPNYYAAHNVGDRSPGTGLNPDIYFGKYYSRNLAEITSNTVTSKVDPLVGYLHPR